MAFISHTPVILPVDRPTGRRPADENVPIDEVSEIGGKYDWLVVGAGITGLSAAHRLGELVPQDRVLLVDARPGSPLRRSKTSSPSAASLLRFHQIHSVRSGSADA